MSNNPKLPRIAIGSFMLESNAHSPVSTRDEFIENVMILPENLLVDLASVTRDRQGVSLAHDEMQKLTGGEWEPVPMIAAAVGASGRSIKRGLTGSSRR